VGFKHPDFVALALVAEMLSKVDGPLYEAIRGGGLAYDARLEVDGWLRKVAFSLFETTRPVEASKRFFEILKDFPR
jgi:Zn-dependent M16 (insulinase) family peptidase